MNSKEALAKMFAVLEIHNVFASPQFAKDISSLVETDIEKFIETFTRDLSRKCLKGYNKYERLSLNKNQKKKLDGNALYRYEYRNTSNLRCIYIIMKENNNKNTFLLNAFNEDKNKTGGKNSYSFNIERAIRTYQSIKRK